MDKEKFLLLLSLEIDTLKAHISRLKPAGYTVHPLDMELLRKKATDLYDLMLQFEMNPTKDSDNQKEPVVFTIKKPETKPVEQPTPHIPVETAQPSPIREQPVPPEPDKPLADDVTLTHEPEQTTKVPTKISAENRVEAPVQMPEEAPELPAPPVESPVTHPVMEDPVVETPAEMTKPTPITSVPEEIRVEKNIEEMPPAPQPKAPTPKPAPVKTTLDLFSTVPESVGTRTMADSDNSVAGRMQKERLQNIRSAIGINEKFLFLNELFKGDLSRYNRVIDELNAMQTKQGADTYLMELKIEGQFGENHPAFEKLKEIVGRKY